MIIVLISNYKDDLFFYRSEKLKIQMPYIDLGQFYLRDLCREDYLDFFDIASKEEVTRYLTYGPLKKPAEALHLLEEFNLKRPLQGLPVGYAIVWKKNQKMIGLIEYHSYYSGVNGCEIGFFLHPDYQKCGIMTKCFKQMIFLGFNYLELDKIIAAHVDLNIASKNIILKQGFQYEREAYGAFEGKDGTYRNIVYYSLYKYEFERMMNNGC